MNNSPFKFLNAYEKEDKNFFFGREEETEALYQMTFDTRLILLYGASGTGKTSLLQAGLANKFSETRWKDILIRRNDHLQESLLFNLRRELEQAGGQWPKAGLSPIEAIRQIHQLTFLPIFLLFDQFEELFILSRDTGEQQEFFNFIQDLLNANLPCKVILVLREEFLANLWEFEQTVPALFDHRFRVERMRTEQLRRVVDGTLNTLVKRKQLRVEKAPEVASGIIQRLTVEKTGVELAYLQVYLDQLYQLARSDDEETVPVFNPELVARLGTVEDVIGDFLDTQLQQLENRLQEDQQGLPIRILGALVSDEQTKKVVSEADLEAIRKKGGLSPTEFEGFLTAFEQMRILKRYTVKGSLKLELSHDIVAKKIWERLPEVDKQLRQIKKSLEQRRLDYQADKGSLLGEKELNAWAYYFPRLDLDPVTEQYIESSRSALTEQKRAEEERIIREKEQIEKNRRLQSRIGRGLLGLGAVIVILLLLTLQARSRLVDARTKNINFLLAESEAQIHTLEYRSAGALLQTAFGLDRKNEAVGKSLMEIAYFFNESDNLEEISGLVDTLAQVYGEKADTTIDDRETFRRWLNELDPKHFQVLEKRYYPDMVSIPGGVFSIGCDTTTRNDCSPLALPMHQFEVNDFQLARTETTVWQYFLFLKNNGKELGEAPPWGWSGDFPVSNVKWPEAVAYCDWLNERRSPAALRTFRLPSEPEWEYAAKDGADGISYRYSGGDQLDSLAWYDGNSEAARPVAGKAPNSLGIYDLTGNVWEWSNSPYQLYPLNDTTTIRENFRMLRGGGYDSGAIRTSVTTRLPMNPAPNYNIPAYGFRVALGNSF